MSSIARSRAPDLHRLVGVVLADRVDDGFRFCLHQLRHVGEPGEAERQLVLRQHDAALGDVGGVVADALQVAGDLQRRDDLPQVAGHRLAQRQHADDELLDLALQRIDLRIVLDHAGGRRGVAIQDRVGGERHLAFDHAAHLGDQVAQALQFLVVALDDMLGGVGHRRLRWRDRVPAQPNRPVMYSCVRRSLRRGEHLRGRRHLDHLAQVEERHLVGAARRLLHVVGDDDDGEVALQLVDQLLDLQRADRVERGGRLVEQDHLRPHRDGARDAQPLLLAARQAHRRAGRAGPSPRPTARRGSATIRRARPSPTWTAARAASRRRRCCRRSTSGTASASGTPCRSRLRSSFRSTSGSRMFSPSISTSPVARWSG